MKDVAALWSAQYKQQEALVADRSPAKASWPREENTIQAYRSGGIRAARTVSTRIAAADDFERWCADQVGADIDEPLKWWSTYGKDAYPHLAQMASTYCLYQQ
jgi:hypothetical protein